MNETQAKLYEQLPDGLLDLRPDGRVLGVIKDHEIKQEQSARNAGPNESAIKAGILSGMAAFKLAADATLVNLDSRLAAASTLIVAAQANITLGRNNVAASGTMAAGEKVTIIGQLDAGFNQMTTVTTSIATIRQLLSAFRLKLAQWLVQ